MELGRKFTPFILHKKYIYTFSESGLPYRYYTALVKDSECYIENVDGEYVTLRLKNPDENACIEFSSFVELIPDSTKAKEKYEDFKNISTLAGKIFFKQLNETT